MKKLVVLIMIFSLILTVAVAGCAAPTKIKSQTEATGATVNTSGSIEKIESTLGQIDKSLG